VKPDRCRSESHKSDSEEIHLVPAVLVSRRAIDRLWAKQGIRILDQFFG
jgi:hypothetical protein